MGYTLDVEQRLRDHNCGNSPHTAKYIPWKLEVFIAFNEKGVALDFEKYLKSHSGRAFAKKRFW